MVKQFISGYDNCNSALSGQLFLLLPLLSCRRVWSHVFCGPHIFEALRAAPELSAAGIIAQKVSKLEIRSVERGICPIATSIINELFL